MAKPVEQDGISTQAFQDVVEEFVRRGFNRDRAIQMATAQSKTKAAKGKPEDRDIYHGEYSLPSKPSYRL